MATAPIPPNLFVSGLNSIYAASDVAQGFRNLITLPSQQAAIANMTLGCQALVGLGAGAMVTGTTLGTAEFLALGMGIAAAKTSEAGCTLVATNMVQDLNNAASNLETLFLFAKGVMSFTAQQLTDVTNLNNAALAGNFSAAQAAANKFVTDSNFVGLTDNSSGITYQGSGTTLNLSTNWEPTSFASTDSTGDIINTSYGSSSGVDFTSTYKNSSGTLFGTVTGNADGSGFISADGQIVNFDSQTSPILTFGSNGDTLVNFTSSTPNSTTVNIDMSAKGPTITVQGAVVTDTLTNGKATIDSMGDVTFSSSVGSLNYNNAGQLIGQTTINSNGTSQQVIYNSDNTVTTNFNAAGQPTTGTAVFSGGGHSATTYSTDNSVPWQAQANIYNAGGQLIGTQTVNKDGSYNFTNIDPNTGEVQVSTNYNNQNQITSQTVSPDVSMDMLISAVTDTLAAQLISQVLIKNNLPASIAAQAFATAAIKSQIEPLSQGFTAEFASSIFDIAGSIIGSSAGAQVAKALGLPPEAGSIVGGVAGNIAAQKLVQQASSLLGITNTASAAQSASTLTTALDGLAAAGGGLLGSQLANLIIPSNVEGEITGAISSAAALALLADPLTAPLEIFAIAFGSDFLGTILGDLFGGLFGGGVSVGPNANTGIWYDATSKQFITGNSSADNGGDISITQNMATTAANTLNSILQAIGGTVSFTTKTVDPNGSTTYPRFGVGYFKGQFNAEDSNDGNGNEYQQNMFSTAQGSVNNAVMRIIKQTHITGGDVYMQSVFNNTTATTTDALISDLNAAHAFSLYITNPAAFYLSLVMSGDPTQLSTWHTELARANQLGLNLLQVPGSTLLGNNGSASLTNGSVFMNPNTTGASITGNENVIYAVGTDTFTSIGEDDTISATNSTINLNWDSDGTIVLGDGNKITASDGNHFMVMGSSDTITMTSNDSVQVNFGTGDIINGSGQIINAASGVSLTVNGGGDTITADAGDTITLSGNGQYGWADVVNMSNGTIVLAANTSGRVSGSGNTVTAGINDFFGIYSGNNNTVTFGTGGNFFVSATGTAITGTIVNIANGIVSATGIASMTINGGGNNITGASGETFNVNGTGDVINGSGFTVNGAANTSFKVTGGDTITEASGDSLTITGSTSDTVTMNGSNASLTDQTSVANTINVNGTGDVINSNGNTINGGANASFTVNGGDTITEGMGDSLTVTGSRAETVTMNGNNATFTDQTTVTNTITVNGTGDTVNGASNIINIGSKNASAVINGNNETVTFASGITDNNLWLQHVGNDLVIDMMGTSSTIRVTNYFTSNGTQHFVDGSGLKMDTQIAQLVSAMATYTSQHSGFNPATTSVVPTNTALQSAIAVAWHH